MEKPQDPANEQLRIQALRTLEILDSDPEERFDRITRMAKRMFGVPISLVSLVDTERQWFKSKQGLEACETSRDISFCGHAILGDEIFIIENALEDKRFADNPLVLEDPKIRFYAGCPLKIANGLKLGTLCLIDRVPRSLDEEDKQLLRDLAAMVEKEISAIQMATLDELTMISNRRGFMTLAEHTLKVCRRKKMPVCVLLFDLDKFKPINDQYGHHEGDFALTTFARCMQVGFRESDVIARLGGDEFVVLLADSNDAEIDRALKRFSQILALANQEADKPFNIEFSTGIACFESTANLDIETMLEKADQAMYQNKKTQR